MTVTGVAQEGVIGSVLETWRKFGIFDFVLPFMLVFAIVYGILEQTKLFGEKVGKSVNAIIAFTIAMTTTLTGWFIGFVTGFLPWVSVISIIIVTGLMLVAIFAKDFPGLIEAHKKEVLTYGAVIVMLSLGAVLLWLGSPILEQLDLEGLLTKIGLTISDVWGIVFFMAFIAALYLIGTGGKLKKGSGGTS